MMDMEHHNTRKNARESVKLACESASDGRIIGR